MDGIRNVFDQLPGLYEVECLDQGKYFCLPWPGYVGAILLCDGESGFIVNITETTNPYKPALGENRHVLVGQWLHNNSLVDVHVDCILQALAVIDNFIATQTEVKRG